MQKLPKIYGNLDRVAGGEIGIPNNDIWGFCFGIKFYGGFFYEDVQKDCCNRSGCGDYREIQNPKIAARVRYFKEETEGVATMCKTMQVIVDREREDAEVEKGKRIALNLWNGGEHDLDKIARTTELTLEQVREAITEMRSA